MEILLGLTFKAPDTNNSNISTSRINTNFYSFPSLPGIETPLFYRRSKASTFKQFIYLTFWYKEIITTERRFCIMLFFVLLNEFFIIHFEANSKNKILVLLCMRPYIEVLTNRIKWKDKASCVGCVSEGNILCMNWFSWTQITCNCWIYCEKVKRH
jgi:hypothetical protein